MIERYFIRGLRLKWIYPGDNAAGVKNGSIIANPPPAGTPMTYDGFDGELFDAGAPHFSAVGLHKGMTIPHRWLTFAHGHTSRLPLAGGDVLTGFMSGCLVAVWSDNGVPQVGHVGTIESSAAISKQVRSTFAAAISRDATGFNPLEAWAGNDLMNTIRAFKVPPQPKVAALVTSTREFYSILLLKPFGVADEWCVGGIKRVQPMSRDTLYLNLKKLRDE